MSKRNEIKKLISFDFDDTLVHTPLPQEGKIIWKEKTGEDWPHRGWWSKPESLDTEIFEIPLNKKIYRKYEQAISDPDNYVILATGRIAPLRDEVYKILGDYGFEFDEIHLNPGVDTFDFKSNLFAKLIYELQPEEFVMYDDRQEHLVRFVSWANAMPCKVTIIDAISGEEFKSEEDINLQEQISRIKTIMNLSEQDEEKGAQIKPNMDKFFKGALWLKDLDKKIIKGSYSAEGKAGAYDALHSFHRRASDGFGGRMNTIVKDGIKEYKKDKKINAVDIKGVNIDIDPNTLTVNWEVTIGPSTDGYTYEEFDSRGSAGGGEGAVNKQLEGMHSYHSGKPKLVYHYDETIPVCFNSMGKKLSNCKGTINMQQKFFKYGKKV